MGPVEVLPRVPFLLSPSSEMLSFKVSPGFKHTACIYPAGAFRSPSPA